MLEVDARVLATCYFFTAQHSQKEFHMALCFSINCVSVIELLEMKWTRINRGNIAAWWYRFMSKEQSLRQNVNNSMWQMKVCWTKLILCTMSTNRRTWTNTRSECTACTLCIMILFKMSPTPALTQALLLALMNDTTSNGIIYFLSLARADPLCAKTARI